MSNSHRAMVALIHPPVAIPSEPPAGAAMLAAGLRGSGVDCRVWDAGIEGLHYLLNHDAGDAADTFTRRSRHHVRRNVDILRSAAGYRSWQRHATAVSEINRVLQQAVGSADDVLRMTDYRHHRWSPLRSRDLQAAADAPGENPFTPYYRDQLLPALVRVNPDLIGISVNFLSQALCASALAGLIRRELPGVTLAMGGGLMTSWMSQPSWKNPLPGIVDVCIPGAGEDAIVRLAGGSGQRLTVPPDYTDTFHNPYLSGAPVLPYSASRGCYWRRCAFCPEKAEDGRWRPIPDDRVIRHLRALVRQYRPAMIHFLDNAIRPSLLDALIDSPPGVDWYGFVRISPRLADPGYCEALRRAGCVLLQVGIESGDAGVLAAMNKGFSPGEMSSALRAVSGAGIGVYGYLLFGTPGEDEAAARRTLEFTVDHRETLTGLNLAIFNMPVNSPEARQFGTDPFYQGDLSLYTAFDHPLGWQRRNVRRFLDKHVKRHPAIASILRRDPLCFGASHMPMFACFQQGRSGQHS